MIENFTTGDMMSIIFLGFGIVFAVLSVIYLVMVGMKIVFYDIPNKKANKDAGNAQKPVVAPALAPVAVQAGDDDEEIAAVIAAIAASMGTESNRIRLTALTEIWQPTFQNDLGGTENEKLYSKDKWKNI